MLVALVLCLALHSELALSSTCNQSLTIVKGRVSNCPVECLNWTQLSPESLIILAPNCSISRLVDLKTFPNMKKIDLSVNQLTGLPENFIDYFPELTQLDLRENPLDSLPLLMLNETNYMLNVSCNCRLAKSIRSLCEKRGGPGCWTRCFRGSGNSSTSVDDFYQDSCRDPLVPVYIGVPLAAIALLLGSGAAVFLVRSRRSKRASIQSSPAGGGKRQSVSIADTSAQRYVTNESWKEGATGSSSPRASPGDYENVLIGQMGPASGKEYRRQVTADDTYYLESDVPASDAYLNDQPIYLNFTGPSANPEDDVYIIPDK